MITFSVTTKNLNRFLSIALVVGLRTTILGQPSQAALNAISTSTVGASSSISSSAASKTVSATASPILTLPTASSTSLQATMSAAKTLAATSAAAAEQALTASNVSQLNTGNWHLETAQKLIWIAADLGKSGSSTAISALATSALQHTQQAASLAPDALTQARSNAFAGFIYLRYLGNPGSALTSYQMAVKLSPNDPAIAQALEKLQRVYARFSAKAQAIAK